MNSNTVNEELQKETIRLKAIVIKILNKYPQGISRENLLQEVPNKVDQEKVDFIIAIMLTEKSIRSLSEDMQQFQQQNLQQAILVIA